MVLTMINGIMTVGPGLHEVRQPGFMRLAQLRKADRRGLAELQRPAAGYADPRDGRAGARSRFDDARRVSAGAAVTT